MSSSSRKRDSISKQRGAEMSSKLMPPYTGAMHWTIRTISSTSWVSRHTGHASMLAKRLNSSALPSIERVAREVDDHTTADGFDHVERGHQSSGVTDRGSERTDLRGAVERYAHGHRIRGARDTHDCNTPFLKRTPFRTP